MQYKVHEVSCCMRVINEVPVTYLSFNIVLHQDHERLLKTSSKTKVNSSKVCAYYKFVLYWRIWICTKNNFIFGLCFDWLQPGSGHVFHSVCYGMQLVRCCILGLLDLAPDLQGSLLGS